VDKIPLRRPRVVEQRLVEVSQPDVIAAVHPRPLYGTPDGPHERLRIATVGVFDGYYQLASEWADIPAAPPHRLPLSKSAPDDPSVAKAIASLGEIGLTKAVGRPDAQGLLPMGDCGTGAVFAGSSVSTKRSKDRA
jgi:hypothetical protein